MFQDDHGGCLWVRMDAMVYKKPERRQEGRCMVFVAGEWGDRTSKRGGKVG